MQARDYELLLCCLLLLTCFVLCVVELCACFARGWLRRQLANFMKAARILFAYRAPLILKSQLSKIATKFFANKLRTNTHRPKLLHLHLNIDPLPTSTGHKLIVHAITFRLSPWGSSYALYSHYSSCICAHIRMRHSYFC